MIIKINFVKNINKIKYISITLYKILKVADIWANKRCLIINNLISKYNNIINKIDIIWILNKII